MNEVVLMQNLDPSTLKSMPGIQYEVDTDTAKDDPYYFIIRKLFRESPSAVGLI